MEKIAYAEIKDLFFLFIESFEQKKTIEYTIQLIKETVRSYGYDIVTTNKKIILVFVGDDKLYCPDENLLEAVNL